MVTMYRRQRVWWIRYRVGGARRRESLHTDNRKVAEALRKRKELELLHAELQAVGAPMGGSVAVGPVAPLVVERNPVAVARRLRLPEREPRDLSLEEIERLLAAAAGEVIAPVVAIAVFAGLRREELCWLTWSDLRLDAEPAMVSGRVKSIGAKARAFMAAALGGVCDQDLPLWNEPISATVNQAPAVPTLRNRLAGILEIR
ncbi:MAG: hypothetical protein IPM29_00595 [Planctomycetes bacterium]|nr:hypothetical protein [Planctomycetota bacterium]